MKAMEHEVLEDGVFYPERLELEDYKLLEELEDHRRTLIKREAMLARRNIKTPISFEQNRLGLNRVGITRVKEEEVKEAELKMALQGLVIESLSEPHSSEAFAHLQDLKTDDLDPIFQHPIILATMFQHPGSTNPEEETLKQIQSLRPQSQRLAFTEIESEDLDSVPSSPFESTGSPR